MISVAAAISVAISTSSSRSSTRRNTHPPLTTLRQSGQKGDTGPARRQAGWQCLSPSATELPQPLLLVSTGFLPVLPLVSGIALMAARLSARGHQFVKFDGLISSALHLSLKLGERLLADAGSHLGVKRLQRLAPSIFLLRRQRHDFAFTGFLDLGERVIVLFSGDIIGVRRCFGHRLVEAVADIRRQSIPERLVGN